MNPRPPTQPEHESIGSASLPAVWIDTQHQAWQVEVHPDRLVFRGVETIELPKDAWSRDLIITQHGDGFILRVETFKHSVGFVLRREQSEAFLRLIRSATELPDSNREADTTERTPSVELLWPKVSPIAVWALILSSLSFIPLLGLVPAIIAIGLLIFHRRRVRPAQAWRHSRDLCRVAFIFLALGLTVSALATVGLMNNLKTADTDGNPFYSWNCLSVHPGVPLGVSYETPLPRRRGQGEGVSARTQPEPRALARAMVKMRVVSGAASNNSILGFTENVHESELQQFYRSAIASSTPGKREHDWPLIVTVIVVLVFSLSVHEAAHAITAWWLGDDFARRLGRVTLNPIAHLDPFGSLLLPVLLYLANGPVFAWARPVPVRMENVARPHRAHILVSIAGPGSNLLLAAASLLLLLGLGCLVSLLVPQAVVENYSGGLFENVKASGFAFAPVFGAVCTILKWSFLLNVFLAFFNLIPIPPLDGSWVLQHLFPRTLGRLYEAVRPYSFLVFIGLIYTNAFTYLTLPAIYFVVPGFALLNWCTPF